MKFLLGLALALSIAAPVVAADPVLKMETTITELRGDGTWKMLTAPQITVVNGKQATVEGGKLKFSLTPKLVADDQVEVQIELSERDGKQTKILASPCIVTLLDHVASVQTGSFLITVKASLVK